MSTLNRHAQDLSKVFQCLVKDTEMQFPALSQSLSQDLARVEAAVSNRGNHVFLVDMPQLGKHLDKCLASGHYSRSGITLSKRVSKRVETPKFLRGIHLMVFDSHGCLRKDACPVAVAAYRQLLLFAKKYYVQPSDAMVSTAVEAFVRADMDRPEPSRFWQMKSDEVFGEFVDYTEASGDFSLLSILATVARMISTTLGHYDPSEWRFKHGPGAVSDRTGKFDKYNWSNWSERLESVFPFADYGFHSYSSWACFVDTAGVLEDILPSRLIAVPKTAKSPRLIAAEPVANMWCQQNLHHYFAARIRRSWIGKFISLRNQGQNRALALRGSVSGHLATVDLSAASDTVTCNAVELLFKSNMGLLRALRATRTPYVSQTATTRVAETHTLNMYSTMGNATTFPVESLMFLAIAITAVLHARGLTANLENIKTLHGEVSVYGDDIIVPVESRDSLLRLFHLFGMDCNHDKTFFEGNFRESCGCDAFRGHDVTPFYWRRPYGRTSESLSAVVDFRNEAYRRYMLACSAYAESTLPQGIPEVAYGLGAFGYSTRLKPRVPNGVRWNDGLQRYEARVLTLTGRNEVTRTEGHSALLQYFTEAPSQSDDWEAGYVHASKLKTAWRYTSLDSLGCSVPTL
mgnify:CR=1 FL=1